MEPKKNFPKLVHMAIPSNVLGSRASLLFIPDSGGMLICKHTQLESFNFSIRIDVIQSHNGIDANSGTV